ncbi:MAG: response regulator [Bacteroidales bacterium]|nr:response regulator [Bacteroidales bacterium]MBN2818666.1 response regulator [Bacteroidales bacterium]
MIRILSILLVIHLYVPISAGPMGALFDNYSVEDGLNDKTIHCIFQDSKGWIWIGTDFGVLRFDGYVFHKFTIDCHESKILSNTLIRTITEDSKGVIWIGTENQGVFRYDRNYYKIQQIGGNSLSNNSVWSIVEDDNQKLWFGTEFGLDYYNPETGKTELIINSRTQPGLLLGDFVRKVFIDNEKHIWVGTQNGLTVLNQDISLFKNLLSEKPVIDEMENQVWEIYQDVQMNVWIGTYLGGLSKYKPQTGEIQQIVLDDAINRSQTVRSIVQDRRGNIWVGTRGGLFSLEKKTNKISSFTQNILDEFSLVHNSVLCLLIDAKGDLWAGTRNGISFLNFDRQAFGYITTSPGQELSLNNSEVYVLWESPNEDIWIGTESGGVNIFNRKTNSIKYLTSYQNLSNNCIKAIHPDSKGNVLIGTYLGGLNQYNPVTGENKIYQHDENDPNSISDNSIWTIYTDSKDQIWVGTATGVDLFDDINGTFIHFGSKFEVSWVSLIYEDPEGRLWMYSGDMKKLTMITPGGTIRHFPYKTRSITNDNDGYLWISTMGNGLLRYDPHKNKVISYTTKHGLCSNVIYGMINVDMKHLWLSTNNGLSRFDLETKSFKNYYVSNGLLNSQFNYSATLHCSDNTLVFGGKKGVDFVYLNDLRENTYVPPVVLTGIKIFNKEVSIVSDTSEKSILNNFICETDAITLNYDQNMISFEFAALNYTNSNKNTYKYKLIGFDKDWNDIGTNHSATYTNLDHGEYVLRVLGSNSDNRFNPDGLSLKLNILPPFWKTWTFRFIIIGVIIALFYLIYVFIINREKLRHQLIFERQNARQIQELDRLKHQFFMNISHEIRTPLSLIVGPLDKLLTVNMDRDTELSHLNIIKRNTTILSRLVNQLLDYRKLETGNLKLELQQGNLSAFLKEIIDQFRQLSENKSIDLDLNISHKSIFFAFDSDKLEKILNNLISNAIKYTNNGGKITVSVSLMFVDELENTNNFIPTIDLAQEEINQYVKIVVRDTGIGIPSNQIMRIFDRFKQIENKYRKSAPGTGIGLSLTKELVKLHNGHIKVKSVEGKGSKFTLLIPYIQIEEEKTTENSIIDTQQETFGMEENEILMQEPVERVADKHQAIILVVDDNADLRQFIKHHFEPEYLVIEAEDGRQAFDKALDTVPDLIVADIMMPHTDGVELCRKIKNDERTSHIPLLLLTALTSKEKQLAGIAAGADDYIVKPFDMTLLKAKVDNLLYIRKALRERYSKEMLLKPKDIVLTSPDEKFLRKVIQVIERNIAKPDLDVDFLAKHVGVSRTQLYRKISALTDMAAKEFVKDIRLKRAAQLISQDKLNISEIAYEVGFNDISYFRKCFKEKFNMSASKYLKQTSS